MEYITQRKADILHPELIYDMIWYDDIIIKATDYMSKGTFLVLEYFTRWEPNIPNSQLIYDMIW